MLLGLLTGAADVGSYSGAFKLFSLGLSVAALYQSVLLPDLARRATVSASAVRPALNASLQRSLLVAVPVSLAGLVLARPVMHLLFPPAFDVATGALQILLIALPLHLAAGHFRTALVATGRQRRDLGLVTAGAIIHIAAKLLLIPLLGISGAAWGTLAGEAMLLFASWRVARAIER